MRATLRILAAASLAAVTFNSFAATDGIAGSSSSNGNFDITLTVPPQIIVKNFNDMTLNTGGATLGSAIEGTEDICVGGTSGVGSYSVNLSSQNGTTGGGAGATDSFQLNGTGQNLPYSAAFIDNTSSTSGTAADTNGDISGTFTVNGNLGCNTDNARVFVSVDAAAWETASESSYSDTLTVTVTAL